MTHQHTTQSKTSENDRASQASTKAKSVAPAMHPMLHLQRQVGNQAVGRLIQAKLTVGEPNDVYEQEADRMAATVVSQIHAPQNVSTDRTASVQRQAINNEGEELRAKPLIQCKTDVGGMAVSSEIESSIQQARGSGQPLADSIRTPMEQAFGADFSGVRVHTGAESDRLNRSIQARAFTTGQDVFFRQGAYQPGSRGGQELIAHELTHVVQQKGRVVQGLHRKQKTVGLHTFSQYSSPLAEDGVLQEKGEMGADHRQGKVEEKIQLDYFPTEIVQNDSRISSEQRQIVTQSELSLQAEWEKGEEGKTCWKGEWPVSRLMIKAPDPNLDLKGYQPAPLLFWNQNQQKYEPGSSRYDFEILKTNEVKSKFIKYYNDLLFWREFAIDEKLKESVHIISQIIDTFDEAKKDDGEKALFAKTEAGQILGVSIYKFNGTLEGAPEIPETEEQWLYVVYSAACPFSQISRSKRGPVFGGTGTAMYKHFDMFAKLYKNPIYQHAENPISYLALIRAGYQDVYASKDDFELPVMN
jgi:Domain of unknown function (DUF4157)